jgi:hypothetical protein
VNDDVSRRGVLSGNPRNSSILLSGSSRIETRAPAETRSHERKTIRTERLLRRKPAHPLSERAAEKAAAARIGCPTKSFEINTPVEGFREV